MISEVTILEYTQLRGKESPVLLLMNVNFVLILHIETILTDR